ncbi:MAG: hypothetical protein ACOC07_12035 [Coleofasciculus sp.]|uniref:hypothetical protein n=1 Tax=Coleofasciculus sp. TaxID=3100458 RepID=UPI003A306BB1
MSNESDQLLYVISAKKEMSWVSFKETFDYLYQLQAAALSVDIDRIKDKRFIAVRALDSLGHCNFDFRENGSRVYVAPPVLVRLPCAGLPQAILAGVRSPQSIEHLSKACQSISSHVKLEITQQPGELVLMPVRVAVQVGDVAELEAIAESVGIAFLETPSAWSLLHFAASLADYKNTLHWSTTPELTWNRQTFNPNFCQFRQHQATDSHIRLSRYSHPSRNTSIYYLWQEESCTPVDLDWGRYAVLSSLSINVLVYDPHQLIMAVPAGAKLPRLLERVLTLCSGYVAIFVDQLPHSSEIRSFNLFSAIPPQIAEMTAAKLGQTLCLQSLDIKG